MHFYFSQIYNTSKYTEIVVQIENSLNKLFDYYEEERVHCNGGSGSNIDTKNHENVYESSRATPMTSRFL